MTLRLHAALTYHITAMVVAAAQGPNVNLNLGRLKYPNMNLNLGGQERRSHGGGRLGTVGSRQHGSPGWRVIKGGGSKSRGGEQRSPGWGGGESAEQELTKVKNRMMISRSRDDGVEQRLETCQLSSPSACEIWIEIRC